MSKAAYRLCLLLAVLLSLAACSGSGPAQPSGDVSVLGTAAPPTENTTAVEAPQAPRGGNPGIRVASLPVGGSSELAPGSDIVQCLRVKWVLSDSIPAGLSVALVDVHFDSEVFSPASGCPLPSCVGYVFQGSDTACDKAIRPKESGMSILLSTTSVSASAEGRVRCADSEGAACKDFLALARSQPSTLSATLPVPTPTPESGTGGNAPPQTTSPETTSPATSAGPGG